MVMSVRVSVRPTPRPSDSPSGAPSALFANMLWHIGLKFWTWLCFNVLQIKFEFRRFASIYEGVVPLCELRIKEMCSFSTFFSYLLWHYELKFYTWLWFNVLQIKFECRRFASIFIHPSSDGTFYGMVMSVWVSVRPTLRPSIRPTLRPSGSPSARFPNFSPTWFDILSWNFAHDFLLMYYRSSSNVVTLRQF